MQLIEAFVRNPVKVAVGVLLIAMFGILAIYRMPMQLTPEVQIPTITIETRWPGASPQEVEREIVQEQEEQLKGVEGVTKMTSESMDSFGRITLEFAVATNMTDARSAVDSSLGQVPEYPEDADEPVLRTSSSSDRPIAWFILSPRMPSAEVIAAMEQQHPELAPALEHVRQTHSAGLAFYRLRQLAKEHPEVQSLLPAAVDVTKLRKFAEDVIEAEFERVPGVANANVFGGREEELQVVVDPQRLAARQVTISDLRRALRGQNQDTSAGDFWEGKRRYVVRTLGQFRTPEQVANTVLVRRRDATVYLRDVAEVRLGYKKPDGMVRRFGSPNMAVNCQRATGANVLDVMEGLRRAAARLNAGVLQQRGLQLSQVYDETEYITSAIGLVKDNLFVGGLLTVIVLLLFLRSARSTVIIMLHILVSTIGAFLAMFLMGRSLNVLALGGLAFAVGMLVDNAIVMLENIYRRHHNGEDAITASVRGAKEVWGALLNATIANLAVFIPVLFVQDQAGQLFRDIALAISASVGLSMLVAIAMVPTATTRLLSKFRTGALPSGEGDGVARRDGQPLAEQKPATTMLGNFLLPAFAGYQTFRRWLSPVLGLVLRPLDAFGRGFINLVVRINAWLQEGVLRRLAVVTGLVGFSLLLSYVLLPKVEYLPVGNRNLVFGILLPPPGYNIDELARMGEFIEARLKPYWDADPGSLEAARLPYPVIGDFFYAARGRQVFLGLRAAEPLRASELVPLVQQVAAGIPGTLVVVNQSSLFEQGLTAGRTIDVEVTGPELTKLVALGGQIMGQVQQIIPGAQAFPRPSLDLSSPEVHVVPKREQAEDMGITAADLGYTVDALVDGAYATDYFVGGDKIDLTIVGQERFAAHTQDLEALPVATPTGELVPLAAVANVKLGSGPEQINHRERQRAITIQVIPPPAVPLENAMGLITNEIVQPLQRSGQLEGAYQINLSGTADKLRATWLSLRFNFILAVVITYLFMAATFESWLYPFVVILSVPLGAVGGFAGLWLLNQFVLQPLDVLTMLGFVMLVGTVVNNPILIVEQSLIHIRDEGMPLRQGILDSVRYRIRPIFMTTLGGLVGLLPLVISPGAGSELYRGIGAVMLGGLVVSTIFTLFLVPALFSLTLEAKEALRRLFTLEPRAAVDLRLAQPERPLPVPQLEPVMAEHAQLGPE